MTDPDPDPTDDDADDASDSTDDALEDAREDAREDAHDQVPESDGPDDAAHADQLFMAAGGRPDHPGPAEDRAAAAPPEPASAPRQPASPTPALRQRAAGYGYHAPPPSTPDGTGGYRAGPYPAGPPLPPQPQFGRRPPQHGPRPDADGYYPSDYYLGTDWTRVVVGGLAILALVIATAAAGLWVYDRFDDRANPDEDEEVAVATPVPQVPVYACAGDPEPVTEMEPPVGALIAGRDAGSRWLAFRNPQAPPLQLWVRANSVPDFDPSTVGVVSCSSSPTEFPTPLNAPTPRLTIPTPTPLESPTP